MVSLMLGHNKFSGEMPDDLYQIPLVTYLDISNNKCGPAPGPGLPRLTPFLSCCSPPDTQRDPGAVTQGTPLSAPLSTTNTVLPIAGPTEPLSPPAATLITHSLVGEVNDGISLLIYLTDFDASGNHLTGAVGSGLFFLPQIQRLNIANNRFTGTLDPNLG
jgi:hypothetical protein